MTGPEHVQTLFRLLIDVSPPLKIQILGIVQNLLRIKVPCEVFALGLKNIDVICDSRVQFKDLLTQKLFLLSLQMRMRQTQSIFKHDQGGKYDVFVHLTRTIAVCLA